MLLAAGRGAGGPSPEPAVAHLLNAAFAAARCHLAAALLGPDGCRCKCGTKAAGYRHGMCGACYEWERRCK